MIVYNHHSRDIVRISELLIIQMILPYDINSIYHMIIKKKVEKVSVLYEEELDW